MIVVYTQGCPDCLPKLKGAARVLGTARKFRLGGYLVVLKGTQEGVLTDNIPAELRDCVLLDQRNQVGTGFGISDMTALVIDRDGLLVYRGSPEEAVGMVTEVGRNE